MTVAYLTHDDVNAAAARTFAARAGLGLVVLDVRQSDPAAVGVVCDLDYLPPEVKAGLLANARAGVDLSAVAVHSYRLTPAERRALRAAGAAVARRLSASLLGAPANGGAHRRVRFAIGI